MTELEQKLVLKALQMAIHEAEGWYDECRGAEPDGRVPGMHYCYDMLEKHGMKTLREESAAPAQKPFDIEQAVSRPAIAWCDQIDAEMLRLLASR